MIAPLLAFSLVGLIIFYIQNLVFFPYVHLRLLALLLFYVSLRPSLPLALGLSLVLASGLVGLYPKGLVFGKVTKADKKKPGVFQEIEVTPNVDLSTLEEVLVVKVADLALSEP